MLQLLSGQAVPLEGLLALSSEMTLQAVWCLREVAILFSLSLLTRLVRLRVLRRLLVVMLGKWVVENRTVVVVIGLSKFLRRCRMLMGDALLRSILFVYAWFLVSRRTRRGHGQKRTKRDHAGGDVMERLLI